ncbi:MAG: DUF6491 family protein [Sphingomicrobium sp.]
MFKRRTSIALFLTAIAAGGCTNALGSPGMAGQSSRQCFLASAVNSFNANADGTVDIQAGANQYFRLTTDGTCPGIDWKTQVGIQTTSGGDFVCNGYDARFVVPDPGMGTERCNITAIAPLTKEQYLAARAAK